MNSKSYRQVSSELNNLCKDRIILSVYLFSLFQRIIFNDTFSWSSMRPDIKANTFSNPFLSDSGRGVPDFLVSHRLQSCDGVPS